MTTPQKNKGDNYERELAKYLNETVYGQDVCARAPLSGGGTIGQSGGADLINTEGLFVEAKRVERLNFRDAVAPSERNMGKRKPKETPIVITRRNRETMENSLCVLRLKDFIEFYRAWLQSNGSSPLGGMPARDD